MSVTELMSWRFEDELSRKSLIAVKHSKQESGKSIKKTSHLWLLREPVPSHVVANSTALVSASQGDKHTYRTLKSSSLYVKASPKVLTLSINACQIDGTAQIIYEESKLNESYPSQGTTSLSLKSFLFILASTQRDLQEHFREQTPIKEDGTYNIRIA